MNILLTNDDGVDSPGLLALAQAFGQVAEVTVVAPDGEKSGFGHAFSHRRSVPFRRLELPGGLPALAVDGTPVDCVKLGLFLSKTPTDWVVSGLNRGANVGVDVFYSGTVGAACEGALQGVRGVAFSLHDPDPDSGSTPDVRAAAALCLQVFRQLNERPLPPSVCLNVNIPAGPVDAVCGVFATTQAQQRYRPTFECRPSKNGGDILFKTATNIQPDHADGADFERLKRGWITVTPLSVDRTEKSLLKEMRAWTWTL